MQIESLILNDFGLFRGEHYINLSPLKKQDTLRPIILFGGLNGSGKTTILTAIRLAIYGKQSLGYGVSQKAYDNYLLSKIHRNLKSLNNSDSTFVSIEFIYFNLGKPIKYKVQRSWKLLEGKVVEKLTIHQDGENIPQFSVEECQSFLNELIPLGVSELFFFDGEKIANLAEDGGDNALRDAISKLLGLDIIERLNNDLNIYVRKQHNKSLPLDAKLKLEQYEVEYNNIKKLISEHDDEVQVIHPKIVQAKEALERLENTLNSKGGAWAFSRQSLKEKSESLVEQKRLLEVEVRDFLNGLFPLSLAPNALKILKSQFQNERFLKDWENIATPLGSKIEKLNEVVLQFTPPENKNEVISKVQNIFSDLLLRPDGLESTELLHDIAGKDSIKLEKMIDETLNHVSDRSKSLKNKLESLDAELSTVSLQIGRAPDKDSLNIDLEAIKEKNNLISELTTQKNTHLELAKRSTWQAIELIRKMKHLEALYTSVQSNQTGIELANRARGMLADFVNEITKRKVEKLELEFAETFSRLARKSDAIVMAKINPVTFEVTLYNGKREAISKQELSAGEKQIYAVAMLEALAKTSGRKLPIIIDTPLGRLDSHHRGKLVHNYFPYASHQVIILSTDTEVDKSFYDGLQEHISRSYQLTYDETTGTSQVNEGYFWGKGSNQDGELVNAAE
jgi:DNA sulfur modification protein DndD